ncbi:MAG: DUF3592 domain-containing protein [Gemmataceae bacterium]|nr:DUF3592 domain-containing protein [Gemmataceae bacterium]
MADCAQESFMSTAKAGKRGLQLFMYAVVILISFPLLLAGFSWLITIAKGLPMYNWPKTEATVTSGSVKETQTRRGTEYPTYESVLEFTYNYEVNGVKYSGTRYSPEGNSSKAAMETFRNYIKIGDRRLVHYNSSDPGQSYFTLGFPVSIGGWFVAIFPIIFLPLAGTFLYKSWLSSKAKANVSSQEENLRLSSKRITETGSN